MNAIGKLQAERQRLVERLDQIDNILRQYEELQRMAESYLLADEKDENTSIARTDSDSVQVSDPQNHYIRNRVMPGVRRQKTPMQEFENTVIEILSDADAPLDRSDLYTALTERDVVIGSPNVNSDLNTLSARMSRMKEKVVNVSGFGYWLKDRAFPPGGYDPDGEVEP